MTNVWEWSEGTYLTTFIIGARYLTVLSNCVTLEAVVDELLEQVGEKKTPFVMVSTMNVNNAYQTLIDNELVDLVIGM